MRASLFSYSTLRNDDTDLYNRLSKAGYCTIDLNYDHVSHVEHGDNLRSASEQNTPKVEERANVKLTQLVGPWGLEEAQFSCSYQTIQVCRKTISIAR